MGRGIGSVLLSVCLGLGAPLVVAADAGADSMKARSASGSGHKGAHHGTRRGHGHHRHKDRRYYRYYYRPYPYPYLYPYSYGYGYGAWPRRTPGYRLSDEEQGFAYLLDGDPKRAVSVFAQQAESEPGNAVPKLGYALAMSELGELDLGVWAMRRAVRTDASALRDFDLDARLSARVAALLDVYHPPDHATPHREDAHFMAAALLWVLGDVEAAGSALRAAEEDGDEDDSTAALRRALESQAAADS